MFSAFEEVSEEQIKRQMEQKLKREKTIRDESLKAKMRSLGIDYKATKLYFKLLKENLSKD